MLSDEAYDAALMAAGEDVGTRIRACGGIAYLDCCVTPAVMLCPIVAHHLEHNDEVFDGFEA